MFSSLRSALFVRIVLAWFALFVGSAIATPLIKPAPLQIICAGAGGMKLAPSDGDGTEPTAGAGMECPLCSTGLLAAPPSPHAWVIEDHALAHALRPIAAAHIASAAAPPLPSRGPPDLI
ncbi:MAG: DUF2946 family protein [Betaproteobacteria bacterium]